MDSGGGLVPSPSVFRYGAFTRFWLAQVLTSLAVQIESVTIGWQVYSVARLSHDVEHSAFLVGMVGLAQFLPLFVLTLIAGATADRNDRRTIMLACLGIEIACVAVLAYLATERDPSLAAIFVVAALFGASRAFLSPAAGAMGPMLVPVDILPRAISWGSLGDQSAFIIGPWIGGMLCAVSPGVSYSGAGVFYLLAVFSLLGMRANTRPVPHTGSRIEQIREGISYIRTNRIVLGAISLDLFAVLLGGATALLPVYARDVLDIGPNGFGILRSGPAVGAASMAFILARYPLQRHAGRWLFGGVGVFGLATLVFAVSKSLPLTMVALAVLGAADMISVFLRQSLVQIATPDAMRGRVSAVSSLFVGASNELGEFETGLAARVLGPVGAALFGGAGSLVVTASWAWLFPSLRKADRIDGK